MGGGEWVIIGGRGRVKEVRAVGGGVRTFGRFV